MPILEKIGQPSQAKHWNDSIPLEYHYTAGVAGEEFRRELRDNGRFLAAKCSKCKNTYVPARMFCPECFIEMKDMFPTNKPGYVYSFTIVAKDKNGSKMERPSVIALVKFDATKGGILHRLEVDSPETVSNGMKVEAVLKDRATRTGALSDIVGFRPT